MFYNNFIVTNLQVMYIKQYFKEYSNIDINHSILFGYNLLMTIYVEALHS